MTSTLSIVILTHNEFDELSVLLPWLQQHESCFDELIFIDDFSNADIDRLFSAYNYKVFKRQLNGDFASQRNFALSVSLSEFVFFVDADEIPAHGLLSKLRTIIREMETADCQICSIPRLNVVHDEAEFVDATKLTFSDQQLLEQVPDDQVRLLRKGHGVYYKHAVHEKAVGGRVGLQLPPLVDLCLFHVKKSRRLEQQNQVYSNLEQFSARAIARSIMQKWGMVSLVKTVRSWFGPRWIHLGDQ
jgi:glycosyltransferase involved in cell wall biosynthesis